MMAATVRLTPKGYIIIPKQVRDSLHWNANTELVLLTTEHGVTLQAKIPQQQKIPAKSLRGLLQYKGEPVPTEMLCKPVDYANDRF